MKYRALLVSLAIVLLLTLWMTPISDVRAQDDTPPQPTPASLEVVNEYFSTYTTTTREGESITAGFINGPSEPPDLAEFEASRVTVLDRASTIIPSFPSYDWVFGCSAVSSAMISAYYDNNGYTNMYTGPTNGGVMPLTDTYWSNWSDDYGGYYPNNPLIASHKGVDGRSIEDLGSIDDYWVGTNANDPYITGSWTQHTWNTAIGDYMKTSQSAYGNSDGETMFYNWETGHSYSSQRLTCDFMESNDIDQYDGTYGRKLFYEARGYTVTECYNQFIDPYVSGSFSLADFQAEIDAGHPVLINLQGHSIVGYGYNDSTIYIRNTWNSNPNTIYTMPWGGSYMGMSMYSVSIVHLAEISPDFSKSSPANGTINLNPDAVTLTWEESLNAQSYEYCLNTSPTCSTWTPVGVNRSVFLSSLADAQTYYWQVRAVGSSETTYANDGVLWSFTTFDSSLMTERNFVPLMNN